MPYETFEPLEFGLIVPTLNERDNIEPLLARVALALKDLSWEIVFVDDGSTDGTLDLLRRLAIANPRIRLVQRIGRAGLSTAVVEGMMASAAPIVGVIDGDLQHDETILPNLFALVANGSADIAVGSRYIDGGGTSDWAVERRLASRFATWIGNLFIRTHCSDPMSGFFVTRRDLIVEAHPRLSGIGFKLLIDFMASSPRTLRVGEVPYVFKGRIAGESKMGSAVSIEYLMLLIDKTLGRILPTRLIMFLIVGGMGVGVHLSILAFCLHLALGFALSQTIAVLCAIVFNFTLNNLFTYRDKQLKGWRYLTGLVSFFIISSVGAIGNISVGYFVYATVAHEDIWWVAGLAGAATSALWNFVATSFVTWRTR